MSNDDDLCLSLREFCTFLKKNDVESWSQEKIEKIMGELLELKKSYDDILSTWRFIGSQDQPIYERIQNNFAVYFDELLDINDVNFFERAMIHCMVDGGLSGENMTPRYWRTKNYEYFNPHNIRN